MGLNRYQRVALTVIAITYGVVMVVAFVLHPKLSIVVLGVLGVSMLVLVLTDGWSIGRGRDEWGR